MMLCQEFDQNFDCSMFDLCSMYDQGGFFIAMSTELHKSQMIFIIL